MPQGLRSPQRAAHRRADVLAAARRLFDQESIGAVTMGRIAQEAGVSPGNLYYWFPGKAELVRALFDEWRAASSIPVTAPDAPAAVLAMLWERSAAQQKASAEYGFFQRELFSLLHTDPVLAARYRSNYEARMREFVGLVELVIAAGYLRAPRPPVTVRELVHLRWLVAETAAPFGAAVASDDADAGTLARAVLDGWLTDAGRAELGIDTETQP